MVFYLGCWTGGWVKPTAKRQKKSKLTKKRVKIF